MTLQPTFKTKTIKAMEVTWDGLANTLYKLPLSKHKLMYIHRSGMYLTTSLDFASSISSHNNADSF